MKKQKTFWAEFYNLAGEDDGITFEITQVSLCGDVLRLELPSRGRREGLLDPGMRGILEGD